MSAPLAVVTGASGGIGAACLKEFSAAGFRTIGVDVAGTSYADEHLVVDLADQGCGAEVARGVGERAVAILINNAAIGTYKSLVDTSAEDWDLVMAINLRAPFLIGKALRDHLRKAEGASIINIGSVHGQATSVDAGAYGSSKSGLQALTRAMALEWGPQIRVNCILPGAIDTQMLHAGMNRTSMNIKALESQTPLGRIGEPAEIARVARLIGIDGTFVTGASIVVDGGALARLATEPF